MGDIYYEWITGKKEKRMKDYREKDVMGFIGDMNKSVFPKPCRITVRMTADKRGKTLSLAGSNILIGIPLEAVKDIVKVVDKSEREVENIDEEEAIDKFCADCPYDVEANTIECEQDFDLWWETLDDIEREEYMRAESEDNMADIELVIRIPEEDLKFLKESDGCRWSRAIIEGVINGTPLPKGHGRLIDADKAKENMMFAMCGTGYQTRAMSVLNEYLTPTIIEASTESEE